MHRRYWGIGAVIVSALSGSSFAADPTYEELKAQVQALSARLERLEAQEQNRLHKEDVDATIKAVLADAEQRSKLISADNFTAGWDKGFFIRSADGNYLLRPGVQLQLRNVTTFRTGDDKDTQNGFELRRVRLRLDGNAFTKDLTYSFVWDASRSNGNTSLLDAWVSYRFLPEWSLKAGQFRESWYHEGDVSDTSQLTVERSLVDSILGGSQVDRVQGVALVYGSKDTPFRAQATFHDGANSKNTDFRDVQPGASGAPPVYSANFGFGGRLEYKAFGAWENYSDFTAKNTKQPLLVFGAGFDWTENGDADIIRTTADVQWENDAGLGVYAAVNGNFSELEGEDLFDWGVLAQVGYLISPSWEIFARYDVVVIDEVDDHEAYNEFTVGANYYLGDKGSYLHRAKLTLDVLYLPDGAPSNQTGVGVLASDEPEVVLRGQFTFQL